MPAEANKIATNSRQFSPTIMTRSPGRTLRSRRNTCVSEIAKASCRYVQAPDASTRACRSGELFAHGVTTSLMRAGSRLKISEACFSIVGLEAVIDGNNGNQPSSLQYRGSFLLDLTIRTGDA